MNWTKRAALSVMACGLIAAAPGPADLSKLTILRDVKPGLWTHSFTTIPRNPAAPDRQERACISAAQLQAMIRESLAAGPSEQICPISVGFDSFSKASFTLNCPSIRIPELGVTAPAASMPGEIVRSGREEHWVVSVKTPAVPGKVPTATWRHDYRRLGDCPK